MNELKVIQETISRVRRQTRSQDVLDICDELESRLRVGAAVTSALEHVRGVKPRFDKTTYQRELMRKRRAKAKL